jgi:hypothetical protein
LQGLDGLTLDRTRDFTIQYEEDLAQENLRNGDIAGDDDEQEMGGEENDSRELRYGDHRHMEQTKKKDMNKKEDREGKSRG